MAIRARVQTRGGHKVRRIVRDANRRRRQPRIKVGFFETAKYDDGTPVASVAAWMEYGFESKRFPVYSEKAGKWIFIKRPQGEEPVMVPERPYFRQALAIIEREVNEKLIELIDPKTMTITPSLAEEIGLYAQGVIQERIIELDDPPNAEVTILMKGSDNPLIDQGFMNQSVTYVVER